MNHPLKRLFAPISAIIMIAASSVAISTADTRDPRYDDERVVESAKENAETLESIVAIQEVPDRPWND